MDKEIPENANEQCPGTNSTLAGKEDACKGCPNQKICSSSENKVQPEDPLLAEKLSKIKHKILVLSGKGGVGKSTVSTQLAFALASKGFEVGLLDLDLCGPSIPRLTGLEGHEVHKSSEGWSPVYVDENLGVISIGFMLPNQDDAVIWRGPKKNGLIKQFLVDVDWGELDYLIIDTPPGTSDEHISIVQYLGMDSDKDGAVLVTTGQKVAVNDVRKEINFCQKTNVNILGVIENMSKLICFNCNTDNELFGIKEFNFVSKMVEDYNLELLGDIRFSKELLLFSEEGGSLFDDQKTQKHKTLLEIKNDFNNIVEKVIKKVNKDN